MSMVYNVLLLMNNFLNLGMIFVQVVSYYFKGNNFFQNYVFIEEIDFLVVVRIVVQLFKLDVLIV